MNPVEAQGSDPFFLNVPFNKRWECHKPTIERLYVDEGYELPALIQTMKDDYKFDAVAHQYKHHLRKWRITKSLPTPKKEEAIKAIRKRLRDGTPVGTVKYKDKEVDKKHIRRYIDAEEAKKEKELQFGKNVFMHWNIPYRALKASSVNPGDGPSPFGANASTPSDIAVSPAYAPAGPSPRAAPSPVSAPTPTTVKIIGRVYNERARYLIQGMHDDFLKDMKSYERKVAISWLHQFWFFCFKTTKHFGKGPQHWSPGLLGFSEFQDLGTTPNTPGANIGSSYDHIMSDPDVNEQQHHGENPTTPDMLCRWSIHYFDEDYEGIPSPPPEPQEHFDLNDPESWSSWPGEFDHVDLMRHLQEALQDNSFSNIEVKDLPLSASQIAKAAQKSPGELLQEAFGFAIMARNEDLLSKMINGRDAVNFNVARLFPFHIATSYLDGAKTCCNVLDVLVSRLVGPNLIKNLYTNDLGHTVLDNLMINILKAHTSCPPVTVDDRWRKVKRFAGEEIDVCGRWDADSSSVRGLLANGQPIIPFEWKHMFCHTSAQAICHAIATTFFQFHAPDINTPSGLFLKVCSHCQKSLQLQPLHCLVLIAFHLARSGCEGENLFGILAYLVCLLAYGVDPLRKAHISIEALLGIDRADECSHELLDPVELANRVPDVLKSKWSDEIKLGWQVFHRVLLFAQQERQERTHARNPFGHLNYDEEFRIFIDHEDDHEDDHDEDHAMDESNTEEGQPFCEHNPIDQNFYGGSKDLGTLWAAIQTELVTYRRIAEGDKWISENFNMRALLRGLNSGDGVSHLALVDREMMQPFCRCGRFKDAVDWNCARAQDACAHYFSNLEDWDRSTFITLPESRMW